jgi:glycosyltransferase involved in cell wall biosynthesis
MSLIEHSEGSGQILENAGPGEGLVAVRPRGVNPATATTIVHGVGAVTDSVSRVLEPVLGTLADAGCQQVVIALRSSGSPAPVSCQQTARWVWVGQGDRPIAAGDWLDWIGAIREAQRIEPLAAVHLHGFVPYALGRFFMSGRRPVRLVYTPHGSKAYTGTGFSHRLVRAAAAVLRPSAAERTLVGSEVDALLLQAGHVHRTKIAVDPAFFTQVSTEAAKPLVVGGVLDEPAASAEEFARLAVLIGDTTLAGADFEWVGPAPEATGTLFHAAHVRVSDDPAHAARAASLSRAWMFVCPKATHGVPGHLMEAAACGLPMVVIDSPLHRELVQDGETGFVCQNLAQIVERVRLLLGDDRLRQQMGQSAERWARATAANERAAPDLLAVYGLKPSRRA